MPHLIAYSVAVHADQFRSERELKELKVEIDRLQGKLELDRDKEQTLASELEVVERKSARLNQGRREKLLELENIKVNKMELSHQLYLLSLDDDEARLKLGMIVKSSYILGQQDSIKLVLNQEDPAKIVRNLTLHRYILVSQKKLINEIRALQNRYQSTLGKIENQQVEIDHILAQLETKEQELAQTEKARQHQLALVKKELSEGQSQIKLFKQQEAELKQLLAHLNRNKIDEASPATEKVRQVVATPENQKIALVDSGFIKNRGKLPLPTDAEILNRYGEIRQESGLIWEGLMFDVSEGQNVVAIYSGQVVFSDWFQGYGQLLVLDHGDGYMSLYGHNQLLHATLGSTVDTGELIAFAGSTGGLDKPALYFEVRNNGAPDDPLKWCRL